MQDSWDVTETKLTIELPNARVTLIPSETNKIVATCQVPLRIVTMWFGRGHLIRWRRQIGGQPVGGYVHIRDTGFIRATGGTFNYGGYLGGPTGGQAREEEVTINVPIMITQIFVTSAAFYTVNPALPSRVVDRRRP